MIHVHVHVCASKDAPIKQLSVSVTHSIFLSSERLMPEPSMSSFPSAKEDSEEEDGEGSKLMLVSRGGRWTGSPDM